MKITFLTAVFSLFMISCYTQNSENANSIEDVGYKTKLICYDDFKGDSSNWIAEFEKPNISLLRIEDGKLDVSASRGATIWFKKKLAGNVIITYTVILIDKGGSCDRVSDMNVFWMATNPANENLFTQDGKFSSYDNLNLYYAGVGGHNNSTTRFRKYHSNGDKPVLKEFTDKDHLLVGNKEYSVRIFVNNGRVQYYLNNVLLWDFQDETPYTEGYFGFRTTDSHQQFSGFKVFSIY